MDDRMTLAGMALQGLVSNPDCWDESYEENLRTMSRMAVDYADALLDRLHKVPAPSGGPVASPPGSDSPSTSAGMSTEGAASLHAGEDAAAQIAPPGEPALPPSATAGENPARPVSLASVQDVPKGGDAALQKLAGPHPEWCQCMICTQQRGAASPCAVESGNPAAISKQSAPQPAEKSAGTDPARPSSRKAKGTPCGGPSCRETQQRWIHDPRTCPQYAGKRA